MNKRLTAKRLLKRHNRHSSSALNWAKTKPDLRTLKRDKPAPEAKAAGDRSPAVSA